LDSIEHTQNQYGNVFRFSNQNSSQPVTHDCRKAPKSQRNMKNQLNGHLLVQ